MIIWTLFTFIFCYQNDGFTLIPPRNLQSTQMGFETL
jgi:hypothetical protein